MRGHLKINERSLFNTVELKGVRTLTVASEAVAILCEKRRSYHSISCKVYNFKKVTYILDYKFLEEYFSIGAALTPFFQTKCLLLRNQKEPEDNNWTRPH